MVRYLVPILHAPLSSGSEHLQQLWLFLERNGTHLLMVEGVEQADEAAAVAAANEFCEVNELTLSAPPFCVDAYVFAPIDPTDKDLRSFYSWDETPAGTNPPCEAWRPFLWVRAPGSSEADCWGVNSLLQSVNLGDQVSANAYSVLSAYWKGAAAQGLSQTP